MIRMAVEGVRRNGKHSGHLRTSAIGFPGVCRQPGAAGHRFHQPQPDCVVNTTQHVLEIARRLAGRPDSMLPIILITG